MTMIPRLNRSFIYVMSRERAKLGLLKSRSNFCILADPRNISDIRTTKNKANKSTHLSPAPLHLPNQHTLHYLLRSIHQSLWRSNPIFPHLPRLQPFPQRIKPQHRIPKLTILQALIEIVVTCPGGILYLTRSFEVRCEYYVPTLAGATPWNVGERERGRHT